MMAAKAKKKSKEPEASPTKSLAGELTSLRRNLHRTFRAYERRLAGELALVSSWTETVAKIANPGREQIRDLGDMLGLLRKLKLKPEKGRRRDLRKIDAVLEDLLLLSRQKRTD